MVVAGSVIQVLSFGMLNTFGVFFNPLLDEFGWKGAVGVNATHPSGGQKDMGGLCGREEVIHGPGVRQVQLTMRSGNQVIVAGGLQPPQIAEPNKPR